MRKQSILFGLGLIVAAFLSGCGGDDSSPSPGTVSMNVTDAKPLLPTDGVERVWITFDEVSVHKSGGGWVTLKLAEEHTIDLYQFSNGGKTQFVPPLLIDSGKYTQVRISVISGIIRISGIDSPLEIPSTSLKTDKNFDFDVPSGGAVDLTVDFDLSQSIVLTGSNTYQLKPVLHLNQTSQAVTLQGNIDFGSSTGPATVIVISDRNNNGTLEEPNLLDPSTDEEYTRVFVTDSSQFQIFWLVPSQRYFVQILLGGQKYEETIQPGSLPPGGVFKLNGGKAIFSS